MLPIEFSTQLSATDHANSFITRFFIDRKFWRSVFFYYTFLAVLLSYFIPYAFLYAGLGAVVWVSGVFFYRYIPYMRRIKSEGKLFEKIEWRMTEEYLMAAASSFSARIKIADLYSVTETRKYVYINTAKRIYILIKKSDIKSSDLIEMRTILFNKKIKGTAVS